MKKINQKIMGLALGLGLIFSASSADAFLVADAMRTAEFTLQGVQRMLSLITEYQKVQAKTDELNAWESKKKMEEKDILSSQVYEYLKNTKTTEMGSDKFFPPQENAAAAEEYIKANFFLPADQKEYTVQKQKEVEQRRYAYVESLAKEILSLSAGIRENAQASLAALSEAEVSAGGNIQQIDLLIQTKKTMAEQKAADVLLQAKLLELEVAKMILHMDFQYHENPEKESKK